MGLFDKLFGKKEKETLDKGLQKTKESFLSKITKAIAGKSTVDEEVLDNLEEALVGADVGIDTTVQIINQIEKRVSKDKYLSTGELNTILPGCPSIVHREIHELLHHHIIELLPSDIMR